MESYSVLMTVYEKEEPEHFQLAIDSMVRQTVMTNDFVIVCDGPLTKELDEVIDKALHKFPDLFQIIRLKKNVGIGAATNIGLQHCKNDLIAKMDADDMAALQRCELQLKAFATCPQLTILGGYLAEFDCDPKEPYAIREVPLKNEDIRKFARRRQPFNNVTVMYRKDAVLKVGGYRPMGRNEDFDLYIRLLHAGYYAMNLAEILTSARTDRTAMIRRASWPTLKGCAKSRWYSMRMGYCSILDFLVCVGGQFAVWICPVCIQEWFYQKFLRKVVVQDETAYQHNS